MNVRSEATNKRTAALMTGLTVSFVVELVIIILFLIIFSVAQQRVAPPLALTLLSSIVVAALASISISAGLRTL